jgi:hypothetical protein
MVAEKKDYASNKVRIMTGSNRSGNNFNKAFLLNACVNLVTIALVLHFFGTNFYSLLYLFIVCISLVATLAILINFQGYSFIRSMVLLPSFLMSYNTIIIVGSASSNFGGIFSISVALSLMYVICMTVYEVRSITKKTTFINTAKKSLEKVGAVYYYKPDFSEKLLDLSPIKRNSGWIRYGILGYLQKIFIVIMFLFIAASFYIMEVEESYLASGFLLSIAGIIFGILSRPMIVAFSAEQIATFILEKELNAKK